VDVDTVEKAGDGVVMGAKIIPPSTKLNNITNVFVDIIKIF
jgi:hypothetical protein